MGVNAARIAHPASPENPLRDSNRPKSTLVDKRNAFLWAGGYVPRLAAYQGFETPKPLTVEITHGEADLTQVLADVLKAGVLSDGFLLPTNEGTPQGGVISPLLANIALGVIEERYERWTHHRQKIQARRTCDGVTAALRARMGDRKAGRPVFFPVRYADDFVILVSGTREQAEQEKAELASHLHETMSLELSVDKTRVSDLTEGFAFLGHRVRYKWHPRFGFMPRIEIPNAKRADLRYAVKQVTNRSTTTWSLSQALSSWRETSRVRA
jgi:RNA-directed DNA polymerase